MSKPVTLTELLDEPKFAVGELVRVRIGDHWDWTTSLDDAKPRRVTVVERLFLPTGCALYPLQCWIYNAAWCDCNLEAVSE